jgi:hypothetical protein
MVKGFLVGMLCAVWAGSAVAQTYTAEQRLDMRITGVLLALDTPKRDDVVTVDISVQNTPMLLRLGKVEELSTREKSQVAKNDVLLRKVRFTGPEELMARLLKPETIGKMLTIEGWLNAQDRLFQVTMVNESSEAMPTSK